MGKISEREYLERLAIVKNLAEKLGVKLDDPNYAIATPSHIAKARNQSGSLEVNLYSHDVVTIELSKAPRIAIKLVDLQNPHLAPEGAVYEIETSMYDPSKEDYYLLNGDVATVHVGAFGFILDQVARVRASRLLSKGDIRYVGDRS